MRQRDESEKNASSNFQKHFERDKFRRFKKEKNTQLKKQRANKGIKCKKKRWFEEKTTNEAEEVCAVISVINWKLDSVHRIGL